MKSDNYEYNKKIENILRNMKSLKLSNLNDHTRGIQIEIRGSGEKRKTIRKNRLRNKRVS